MHGNDVFMLILLACVASTVGWIVTTWIRARHGYPIQNSEWGGLVHKGPDGETAERMKLLTQENAQLRAELGSMKDRLVTVERIVTDGSVRLDHEIEALRHPAR